MKTFKPIVVTAGLALMASFSAGILASSAQTSGEVTLLSGTANVPPAKPDQPLPKPAEKKTETKTETKSADTDKTEKPAAKKVVAVDDNDEDPAELTETIARDNKTYKITAQKGQKVRKRTYDSKTGTSVVEEGYEYTVKYVADKTEGTICQTCTTTSAKISSIQSLNDLFSDKNIGSLLAQIDADVKAQADKKAQEKEKESEEKKKELYAKCEAFPKDVLEKYDGKESKAEAACLKDKLADARKRHDADDYEFFQDRIHDLLEEAMDNPNDRRSQSEARDLMRVLCGGSRSMASRSTGRESIRDSDRGYDRTSTRISGGCDAGIRRTYEGLVARNERLRTAGEVESKIINIERLEQQAERYTCTTGYTRNCNPMASYVYKQRANAQAAELQNRLLETSPRSLLQYEVRRAFDGGLNNDDIRDVYSRYAELDNILADSTGKNVFTERDLRELDYASNGIGRDRYARTDDYGLRTGLADRDPRTTAGSTTNSNRLFRAGQGYVFTNHPFPRTLTQPQAGGSQYATSIYNAGGYRPGASYQQYPAPGYQQPSIYPQQQYSSVGPVRGARQL